MDWRARNKLEEFVGISLLLLYWIVCVPWIWLYYKIKGRKPNG